MRPEEFAFQFRPQIDEDAYDLESEEDVEELIRLGDIGLPSEYGYDCHEDFVDAVIENLGVSHRDEVRQDQRAEKWESFLEEYDEAGGIFYNPANPDQYYTDDPSLLE